MKLFYKISGLFFFLVLSQNIFPMARIIIKNNSSKAYEYIVAQKRGECNKLSPQDTITLPIHPSSIENKSESYFDFYDFNQQNLAKRKSLGLGTFILYLSCVKSNDAQINYQAILERKQPSTEILKSFYGTSAHQLNFSLAISDPLEESELALVE